MLEAFLKCLGALVRSPYLRQRYQHPTEEPVHRQSLCSDRPPGDDQVASTNAIIQVFPLGLVTFYREEVSKFRLLGLPSANGVANRGWSPTLLCVNPIFSVVTHLLPPIHSQRVTKL